MCELPPHPFEPDQGEHLDATEATAPGAVAPTLRARRGAEGSLSRLQPLDQWQVPAAVGLGLIAEPETAPAREREQGAPLERGWEQHGAVPLALRAA